ncbi:uncharacterized protein DNG_05911 [Cephalotrichum gorgonifer]|uniref:Nephrocystin 3-like N-terminal domain-containing protein n=1 Tax=Cephalotrichum gorgonifer TaxID=2041049 RepID=A0AAE8N0H9_9PEZI|nr:uncharacterized protein DNG_05911 [Cephalotrichum gorgonifer]
MESRSHNIARAVSGTCNWLLRDDRYKGWSGDSDQGGLLWFKGKPGSGKSTLLKYALDNLRAERSSDGDVILSFFFHGRGDELERTPLGLFRSLLHQAVSQAPSSLSDLVDSFKKKCDEIGEPGTAWKWHQEELKRFLELSLPKVLDLRSVWLFVDALDECGEEDAVWLAREFSSLLKNTSSSTSKRLHICFSCRHYPIMDIENATEICLEDENRDDISTYVQAQLSGLCQTAPSIPATIASLSSGLFLWAFLMVKLVQGRRRGGVRFKAIEAELHRSPTGLDDLYSTLVDSMSDRPASLQLIRWICFATRPLYLDEVLWAMIVDPDCPYESLEECRGAEDFACDCDDICACDVMEKRVKTLTCGLAEVIWGAITQTVHTKGLPWAENGAGNIDAMDAYGRTPLAWAAAEGQEAAVERLLATGKVNLDSKDGLFGSTPLLRAADNGHEAVVRLLLATGRVDVESRDDHGFTPLSWAAFRGNEAILKLLLATGKVNTNPESDNGRTPLSWAASNGHKGIVKLLLDAAKAEIDS